MARLLALEWDASEARVVVASPRGKELFVEQAFSIPLVDRDDAAREPDAARRIAEALAERNLGRSETLVAVGRANIELRLLSVPQAPTEELPDLVRFQAMRQFATIGDDWPLDFVAVDSGAEGQLNVLAAAISPDLVSQIMKVSEAAQLTPRRLILRPFAAAALLRRASQARECRLVVDLMATEVDLTVVAAGQVAFIRTIRLPTDAQGELHVAGLLGEIRRTIGAAQNQLGGRDRVEQITLCGDPGDNESLRQALAQELSLPVRDFDPFAGLMLGERLAAGLPWHRGRFTSLLGMLADEIAGTDHGIDFLHPRKKPAPPSHRRRNLLIGGSLAAAAVAGLMLMFGWLWSLDGEIRRLAKARQDLDAKVKTSEVLRKHSQGIESFVDTDVVLLDEFAWLSEKLPPPEKALVTSFRATKTGAFDLDVLGENSGAVYATEKALRDATHESSGSGSKTDVTQKGYNQSFKVTVRVKPAAATGPAGPTPTPTSATSTPATPTQTEPTPAAPGSASTGTESNSPPAKPQSDNSKSEPSVTAPTAAQPQAPSSDDPKAEPGPEAPPADGSEKGAAQ